MWLWWLVDHGMHQGGVEELVVTATIAMDLVVDGPVPGVTRMLALVPMSWFRL